MVDGPGKSHLHTSDHVTNGTGKTHKSDQPKGSFIVHAVANFAGNLKAKVVIAKLVRLNHSGYLVNNDKLAQLNKKIDSALNSDD